MQDIVLDQPPTHIHIIAGDCGGEGIVAESVAPSTLEISHETSASNYRFLLVGTNLQFSQKEREY